MYTDYMSQTIPVTEARKNLLNLVDRINEDYTRVDLTKNGRVKAVLISSDYLDSLEETIFSLNHSLKEIKTAEKEFKQGKYVTLNEIKEKYNKK